MSRLENLLGAQALSLADRLRDVGAAGGMSASEQAALVTVHAHPDRAVAWLGGILDLTSSGVTRLVDRLVAAGWVIRAPGTDARQRRLRLTPAGKARARALLRDRERVLSDALSSLSDEERADLERLLDHLVAGLAETRLPALRTCRLCDRSACRAQGGHCPLDHAVAEDDPHA